MSIKKELKAYKKFKENYKLDFKEITEKEGCLYFNGELVEDEEKKYAEGEQFLNIGYNFKNSHSKALSNLYPIKFSFRGKKVSSIEGVLQGLKYKDKKMQKLIWNYAGIDAYHTRASNSAEFWGDKGVLYWQGKPINRHNEEYQNFIDELYISALQNPIYRNILLSSGTKYLLHHIGGNDPKQTVLTRFEFECRLNSLRDFIRNN